MRISIGDARRTYNAQVYHDDVRATHAYACRFMGARDDHESAAHYGIMGYFDPSRITESTIRDSIRESPLAPRVSANAFELEVTWKRDKTRKRGTRTRKKGRRIKER